MVSAPRNNTSQQIIAVQDTVPSTNRKFFLLLMAMGFVSGIPFILTLSTLSVWLAEEGFNTKIIGIFTIVSIPYPLKFLWAPFIDQVHLPFLKFLHPVKRFGVLAILFLVIAIVLLAHINPKQDLLLLGITATIVSFFAATHDIVLDTLRIYASDSRKIGGGAASEAIGFRIGMLTSGAGAVYLSVIMGWKNAYLIMAACCLTALLSLWQLPNPPTKNMQKKTKSSLQTLFITPVQTLFQSPYFYPVVGFILTIKIASTVMTALSAPFLFSLGFSKIEYASISKVYGISLMLLGSAAGGMIIYRKNIRYCLTIAALLEMLACFLFIILAFFHWHNVSFLILTLSVENFSSGLIATGFISYVSLFCKNPYIASHFTLLYSLGSLARVFASVSGGYVADTYGWTILFVLSALTLIPALYFLKKTPFQKIP